MGNPVHRVVCKIPDWGNRDGFMPGGGPQLLPGHFLRPELCFPYECGRRARSRLLVADGTGCNGGVRRGSPATWQRYRGHDVVGGAGRFY